jgi:hydrogenase maturation factor
VLTTSSQETPGIMAGLKRKGVQASVIGQVVPAQEGKILKKGETNVPLPIYEQDEITKLFD